MQENKIEILKITLKVGGKDIELSLEQARELKEVLAELFPSREIPHTPIQPILIEPYFPPWKQFETWCSNQGNFTVNCKS